VNQMIEILSEELPNYPGATYAGLSYEVAGGILEATHQFEERSAAPTFPLIDVAQQFKSLSVKRNTIIAPSPTLDNAPGKRDLGSFLSTVVTGAKTVATWNVGTRSALLSGDDIRVFLTEWWIPFLMNCDFVFLQEVDQTAAYQIQKAIVMNQTQQTLQNPTQQTLQNPVQPTHNQTHTVIVSKLHRRQREYTVTIIRHPAPVARLALTLTDCNLVKPSKWCQVHLLNVHISDASARETGAIPDEIYLASQQVVQQPFIIAGDFNRSPTNVNFANFRTHFNLTWDPSVPSSTTVPNPRTNSGNCIDYILINSYFTFGNARVFPVRISQNHNHYLKVAEVL